MRSSALDDSNAVTPLFLYAPDASPAFLKTMASAGWKPLNERRKSHVETSFLASGARVAVVDARYDVDEGLEVVRSLAGAVEINAAALLLLLDVSDEPALDRAVDLGITHWLAAPFSNTALQQQLRLTERSADRLAGKIARIVPPANDAGRDALTGLGDAATARLWVDARLASGRPFAVLLLAITRFEVINTAFGRETGDDILANVARMISPLVNEASRSGGMVARTSGAEFVIGVDGAINDERLVLLAEQLTAQVERPVLSGTHLVPLSSRIVVAGQPQDGDDASRYLRRVSSALADAKSGERERIRVGEEAAARDHDDSLIADLRQALDRDEITILFQPQVSIASGRIEGVEALARWTHPRHGELGAATLFAAAESSDYLVPLSAHIQRRALEAAAAWPAELGRLRLSLNITSADMAAAGFAAAFLAMVDESGFPRSRLTVEITETGLIRDLGAASTLLAELRAGGCRVAIDDFGTGYSSLAYLKMLPLDYLKIDKQLAQDIAGSARDRIVVRGVIDMARSLGLAVIAEGVETDEQLTLLAREGCNIYQGFLCSEPLDSESLSALVADRR